MDATLDDSVEVLFDADLERLNYPLGREELIPSEESNDKLGDLNDPPLITQHVADDLLEGDYDSDLEDVLGVDEGAFIDDKVD